MKKRAYIILLVLLLLLGVTITLSVISWQAREGIEVRGFTSPGNLDYLILQMEWARETHQDIVDNPWRHWSWQKAGIDHAEWVEIYDQVIKVLKDKNE